MKYRKKPVVVEAVQWMGDIESLGEIEELKGVPFSKDEVVDIMKSDEIRIHTLEGEMTASLGDYIIQGVHGEIYPCKPDIFEETYEMVKDDAKASRPRDEHVQYFIVDGNRWLDDLPERIFVREVGYLDDYRSTGKMPAPIAYVREMAEDAAKTSRPRDEHVDDLPERIFVRGCSISWKPAKRDEDDEMSVAEEMWRKTRR